MGPKRIAVFAAGVMAITAPASAQRLAPSAAACPEYKSAEVQTHIQNAYRIAGKDIPPDLIRGLFIVPRTAGLCAPAMVPPYAVNSDPAEPVKVFDQLYYFGDNFVGSWALTTTDGIILFDAMNNTGDVQKIVEPGMAKLGLKPETIKYIVITHGHGDHWGGAKYFQDKYKARVLMGGADWALAAAAPSPDASRPDRPIPPAKDLEITDGQKLTLGGTTVNLYLAPGHTPGSMAAIIPVTDNGTPHVLSLAGGMGIPPQLDPDTSTPKKSEGLKVYLSSVQKVKKNGQDAGADGAISTHPIFDGTIPNTAKIKNRKPGDPNPWILGKEGFARFMDVNFEVAKTIEAMINERAAAKVSN